MTLLLLLLCRAAHADCTKDTDCKGDRICEAGTCVDPGTRASCAKDTDCGGNDVCEQGACVAPGAPAARTPPAATADATAVSAARAASGGVLAREIAAWSLLGTGVVFGVTGSVIGVAEGPWYVATPIGAVGLGALAAAGPVAAGGGGKARRALASLGGEPPGLGTAITGLSCYGTGMALGAVAVGLGLGENSAGGAVGLVAVVPATAGAALLAVDAAAVRHRLDARLQQVRAESAGTRSSALAYVVPYATPTPDGALIGLAVGF